MLSQTTSNFVATQILVD